MSVLVVAWLVPFALALGLLLVASAKKPIIKARLLAELAAGLLLAGFPFLFVAGFSWLAVVMYGALQLCAMLLAARLIFGRLEPAFLIPSTRFNVLLVALMWGLTTGVMVVAAWWPRIFAGDWALPALLVVVLVIHAAFLAQLMWARRHFAITKTTSLRALGGLPTVSVCIPARNEDHALTDCLASVIASDYPKLEIIVLDDCSQDKTSQIVRSFAHDGVRFIKGDVPADGWLGKNQARQSLAEHATGEYLLFIDVDTRLAPHSITELIDYVLDNNLAMMSILPQNRLGAQPGALFDTLRSYWQQVLPIARRRMPVASQAWVINAKRFGRLGGFKSVAHKIMPEASFARRLGDTQEYRFITGNTELGITTAKHWQSLRESAVRVLYPTYKRQPVVALLAAAAIPMLLILPFVAAIYLIIAAQFGVLFVFAGLTSLAALATFGAVRASSLPRTWPLATLLLPVVAAQEVILIVTSLLQYEFGEVNWKGRNVCYPVIASSLQNRRDHGA